MGDRVSKGEVIATLYGNQKSKLAAGVKEAQSAFVIRQEKTEKPKLIKEVLGL